MLWTEYNGHLRDGMKDTKWETRVAGHKALLSGEITVAEYLRKEDET